MPIIIKEFQLDLGPIQAAIRRYHEDSKKTYPQIVNRAALVAIIGGRGVEGVMQRTKKAAREAILAVDVKKVAGYVMNRHKGEKLKRRQVKQLVKKEYRRRIAAIGYTAIVGWSKAAQAFGGRGARRATGHGYFQFGYGTPANSGQWPNFEAVMVNATPAAVLIGEKPLQDALNDTARDMIEYAETVLREGMNRI